MENDKFGFVEIKKVYIEKRYTLIYSVLKG